MNLMDEIKILLEENIDKSIVTVDDMTGTMDHLEIKVISDIFENKSLIAQHQVVMDILKVPLADKLHAVKLKTLTHKKNQGM